MRDLKPVPYHVQTTGPPNYAYSTSPTQMPSQPSSHYPPQSDGLSRSGRHRANGGRHQMGGGGSASVAGSVSVGVGRNGGDNRGRRRRRTVDGVDQPNPNGFNDGRGYGNNGYSSNPENRPHNFDSRRNGPQMGYNSNPDNIDHYQNRRTGGHHPTNGAINSAMGNGSSNMHGTHGRNPDQGGSRNNYGGPVHDSNSTKYKMKGSHSVAGAPRPIDHNPTVMKGSHSVAGAPRPIDHNPTVMRRNSWSYNALGDAVAKNERHNNTNPGEGRGPNGMPPNKSGGPRSRSSSRRRRSTVDNVPRPNISFNNVNFDPQNNKNNGRGIGGDESVATNNTARIIAERRRRRQRSAESGLSSSDRSRNTNTNQNSDSFNSANGNVGSRPNNFPDPSTLEPSTSRTVLRRAESTPVEFPPHSLRTVSENASFRCSNNYDFNNFKMPNDDLRKVSNSGEGFYQPVRKVKSHQGPLNNIAENNGGNPTSINDNSYDRNNNINDSFNNSNKSNNYNKNQEGNHDSFKSASSNVDRSFNSRRRQRRRSSSSNNRSGTSDDGIGLQISSHSYALKNIDHSSKSRRSSNESNGVNIDTPPMSRRSSNQSGPMGIRNSNDNIGVMNVPLGMNLNQNHSRQNELPPHQVQQLVKEMSQLENQLKQQGQEQRHNNYSRRNTPGTDYSSPHSSRRNSNEGAPNGAGTSAQNGKGITGRSPNNGLVVNSSMEKAVEPSGGTKKNAADMMPSDDYTLHGTVNDTVNAQTTRLLLNPLKDNSLKSKKRCCSKTRIIVVMVILLIAAAILVGLFAFDFFGLEKGDQDAVSDISATTVSVPTHSPTRKIIPVVKAPPPDIEGRCSPSNLPGSLSVCLSACVPSACCYSHYAGTPCVSDEHTYNRDTCELYRPHCDIFYDPWPGSTDGIIRSPPPSLGEICSRDEVDIPENEGENFTTSRVSPLRMEVKKKRKHENARVELRGNQRRIMDAQPSNETDIAMDAQPSNETDIGVNSMCKEFCKASKCCYAPVIVYAYAAGLYLSETENGVVYSNASTGDYVMTSCASRPKNFELCGQYEKYCPAELIQDLAASLNSQAWSIRPTPTPTTSSKPSMYNAFTISNPTGNGGAWTSRPTSPSIVSTVPPMYPGQSPSSPTQSAPAPSTPGIIFSSSPSKRASTTNAPYLSYGSGTSPAAQVDSNVPVYPMQPSFEIASPPIPPSLASTPPIPPASNGLPTQNSGLDPTFTSTTTWVEHSSPLIEVPHASFQDISLSCSGAENVQLISTGDAGAVAKCTNACKPGLCCFVDTAGDAIISLWHAFYGEEELQSCFKGNEAACSGYFACLSLTLGSNVTTPTGGNTGDAKEENVASNEAPPIPTEDLTAICSSNSIATPTGLFNCVVACQLGSCCSSHDPENTCFSGNQDVCEFYVPCQGLNDALSDDSTLSSMLPPTPPDNLTRLCSFDTLLAIDTPWIDSDCYDVCQMGRCCFDEKCLDFFHGGNISQLALANLTTSCSTYQPCNNLGGIPTPPSDFDHICNGANATSEECKSICDLGSCCSQSTQSPSHLGSNTTNSLSTTSLSCFDKFTETCLAYSTHCETAWLSSSAQEFSSDNTGATEPTNLSVSTPTKAPTEPAKEQAPTLSPHQMIIPATVSSSLSTLSTMASATTPQTEHSVPSTGTTTSTSTSTIANGNIPSPPSDLSTLCALGADDFCNEVCEAASCCFASNPVESCLATQWATCGMYAPCGVLYS